MRRHNIHQTIGWAVNITSVTIGQPILRRAALRSVKNEEKARRLYDAWLCQPTLDGAIWSDAADSYRLLPTWRPSKFISPRHHSKLPPTIDRIHRKRRVSVQRALAGNFGRSFFSSKYHHDVLRLDSPILMGQ